MFLSFVYLRKGDKGAAAEPFGCAQGGLAHHVGRLRPAWAPVWGPGPCTLLLRVREQASAKLPRRAPIPGEGREAGGWGRGDKDEAAALARAFLMFDWRVVFLKNGLQTNICVFGRNSAGAVQIASAGPFLDEGLNI